MILSMICQMLETVSLSCSIGPARRCFFAIALPGPLPHSTKTLFPAGTPTISRCITLPQYRFFLPTTLFAKGFHVGRDYGSGGEGHCIPARGHGAGTPQHSKSAPPAGCMVQPVIDILLDLRPSVAGAVGVVPDSRLCTERHVWYTFWSGAAFYVVGWLEKMGQRVGAEEEQEKLQAPD